MARMPRIRSEALAAPLTLQTAAGVFVPIDSDAAREKLRANGYGQANPLRLRAKVYDRAAHARKPFRLSGPALESVARQYPGLPVLDRRHEGSLSSLIQGEPEVIGVVQAARVEGTALVLDQDWWGEKQIGELAAGVAPGFSVHLAGNATTKRLCSDCGRDWDGAPAERCDHIPGTKGTLVEWTDAEPVEVTRTFTPAIAGTGVAAVQLDDLADDTVQLITQQALTLLDRLQTQAADAAAHRRTETMAEETAITAEGAAQAARIAELEQTLARERGERAVEAARTVVDAFRAEGRLLGDREAIVPFRLSFPGGPAAFDTFVRQHCAINVAHSTQQITDGGVQQLASGIGGDGASGAIALAAERRAKAEGIDYRTAWTAEYNASRAAAKGK